VLALEDWGEETKTKMEIVETGKNGKKEKEINK
jgi:hypothetical protein